MKNLPSIRVAHVIYSFGIGGLEKGITTLINHGSSDIDHVIISLCGNRESEKFLKKNVEIYCLDKQQGNSIGFIWDLLRLIRKIRPDVVHTRNWSGMDGILAAKLAGVKTIIHGEHGWDMFDPLGTNKKRRRVRKLTSLMVNGYTCVSKQLALWLQTEVGVKKPITQIYNGVDALKSRPSGRQEKNELKKQFGFLPEEFIVGIVARLDAIKNHSTLFQAFKIVAQNHPLAKFVVVGDGPEMELLKFEAFDKILFLGYRSDTALLMRCFDLFVLPSFNEGISNTILEAMATGLPVIVSNAGGNPELVEDEVNGFLVDPVDPIRMADRIMDYINDPDMMARHGAVGRKLAVENFSIESMVKKYETVYQTYYR
jgi:sugar transferase (PEP-CTERM/EpsH1 system associated)